MKRSKKNTQLEIIDLNNDENLENYPDEELNTGLLNMANEDTELIESLRLEKESSQKEHKSFGEWIRSLSTKAILGFSFFIACLCFLVFIILLKADRTESLSDQWAAERWDKNGGSTQISIFMAPEKATASLDEKESVSIISGIDNDVINNIRYELIQNLDSILEDEDASLTIKEDGVDSVLTGKNETEEVLDSEEKFRQGLVETNNLLEGPYNYAYSARGTVSIASGDGIEQSVDGANAIGVGGDFFFFHPLKLKSGSYFDDDELMTDGIIIDTNTAFKLFGSPDIVGMEVVIGSRTYYIRGVYEPDTSHLSHMAKSDSGFIFMHYSHLLEDGMTDGVDCLEFIATEPYKGYLYRYFNETVKGMLTNCGEIEVIQNSNRFGFENLITKVISEWGARSMVTKKLVYPYWENIARGYEDISGVALIAEYILSLILMLMTIMYMSYFYHHRRYHFKDFMDWYEDKIEKQRKKKRANKRHGK